MLNAPKIKNCGLSYIKKAEGSLIRRLPSASITVYLPINAHDFINPIKVEVFPE